MSRDPFPADRRDALEGVEPGSLRQPSPASGAFSERPPRICDPDRTAGDRDRDSRDQTSSRAPRFYHARDRAYLLSDSERRTLEEVGKFRVIAVGDLEEHAYRGNAKQTETDIRRLGRQGLLSDRTLPVPQKKTLRVLTLTKAAHRLLNLARLLPEDQAIYHGLSKPREARHDADLYRLYQKEALRIERAGGRPRRILLDQELMRDLNRDLASLGKDAENEQRKQEIAEKHRLPLVHGRMAIPDLRIEYESSDGEMRYVDLELATRDYRPRAIAAKAAAGFSLYSRAEDAPRLRRILGERELTAGIRVL